jgi:hypothetical protein
VRGTCPTGRQDEARSSRYTLSSQGCDQSGYGGPGEQGRRAALFCRAYGRPADAALLDVVAERLRALIAFMRAEAERGCAAFQAHIDAGHIGLYEADIAYLDTHRAALLGAFDAG